MIFTAIKNRPDDPFRRVYLWDDLGQGDGSWTTPIVDVEMLELGQRVTELYGEETRTGLTQPQVWLAAPEAFRPQMAPLHPTAAFERAMSSGAWVRPGLAHQEVGLKPGEAIEVRNTRERSTAVGDAIETRCVVEVPPDGVLDLRGCAGDGGFVVSRSVQARRLRAGLLVRHVAEDSPNGWWTATEVRGLGVMDPHNVGVRLVDHSGSGQPVFVWLRSDESIEVRTDTAVLPAAAATASAERLDPRARMDTIGGSDAPGLAL